MKDNETIAQFLKITKFPFEINDDGNVTYAEDSNGYWFKRGHDSDGNETFFENSNGYWFKQEFDSDGNQTYYETSDGYWFKQEFDSDGNQTFLEDSEGKTKGNHQRTTITWEEISQKFGIDPDKLKIENKGS